MSFLEDLREFKSLDKIVRTDGAMALNEEQSMRYDYLHSRFSELTVGTLS